MLTTLRRKTEFISTHIVDVTDPNENTSPTKLGKPVKIRGTLKALHDSGIKIKNYSEVDGAGRTITHQRDEEEEDE